MGDWAGLTLALCSCFMILSINIVVLVIGIYVNKGGSIYYGGLIKIETDEWRKAPVYNLQTPNGLQCPNDTQTITGLFNGINSRCNYIGGGYRVGACRRREGFYTSYGMDPVQFSIFDNVKICATRNKDFDYHKLAKMRSKSCMSNTAPCGSKNDTDIRFCIPQSTSCLPNIFNITGTQLLANGTQSSSDYKALSKNMTIKYGTDDNNHNPISEVIYAISAPCSNLAIDYVNRPYKINPLLKDQQLCARYYGDQVEHTLFFPTEYPVNELTVYSQNNLLKDIQSNMKGYVEKEFTMNSYKVFYRTYPKWSLECQNVFQTEDVAQLGLQTSNYASLARSIMIHSIILYVVLIITCASVKILIICTTPIALAVYISLLIHYCITLTRMNAVDLSLLQYAAQYACSDGPLQIALQSFEVEFIKDLRIVKTGLAFCVIGLVFFITMIILLSPLRQCCADCCVKITGNENLRSISEKPAIESKLQSRLDAMRGGMKAGMLAKLAAKKAELDREKANNIDNVVDNTPPPLSNLYGNEYPGGFVAQAPANDTDPPQNNVQPQIIEGNITDRADLGDRPNKI